MKAWVALILLLVLSCSGLRAEGWSSEELRMASTAASVDYLTQEEKNVVMYVNLARLYPRKFVDVVLSGYEYPPYVAPLDRNSEFYTSLVERLSTMKPLDPLFFDSYMYQMAACWAEEMGVSGKTGHTRGNCSELNGLECCAYGFAKARDIVLLLLIDQGVKTLAHRNNLLDARATTIGVATRRHVKYRYGTVIDCDGERFRRNGNAPHLSSTIHMPEYSSDVD